MINRIEVDGFKSLMDFQLGLNPGLNVLVGPNGSGKTNIVLFFEFVSHLMAENLSTSISKAGGAGSIFRRSGKQEIDKVISAKISGILPFTKDDQSLIYEYGFQIQISLEGDKVFFKKQFINFKYRTENSPDGEWDLKVEQECDSDLVSRVHFNITDEALLKKEMWFSQLITKGDEELTNEKLEDYLNKTLRNRSAFNSLLQDVGFISLGLPFFSIKEDLRGGQVFNIIPNRIKATEDIANNPGIQKDGFGLASTLYALIKRPDRKRTVFDLFETQNKESEERERAKNARILERILNEVKLANQAIDSIEVVNDAFSNNLLTKIILKDGEYNAVLPLSVMSDGTLKWLTIITAIYTSSEIFCIEEPENFLHPWMQAEIIKIMRDACLDEDASRVIILTTHSESLINNAKPEELVLVKMNNGRTTAVRVNDVESLKTQISESGFGLGYFYSLGDLNND